MPLICGQTLGRYRIEEQIGAGGMGVVYRVYDEKLERDLAIKVLSAGAIVDAGARKRFRNEARILSRLNHPAIQIIHDFDTVDGHDLLVSELVSGVPLDTRVGAGPMAEGDVVSLGVQLAQGLAAAHASGVLHRDLKPANLRVTPDGRLKILDFGLAVISNTLASSLTATTRSIQDLSSSVAGTLPYMSPEQLLGESIDERSDLYSAGVVLFELLTARLPFEQNLLLQLTDAIVHAAPPSPSHFAARVSPEMDRIVLKCLEKDRELRYQSAKDLAVDLKRLQTGLSTAPSSTFRFRGKRKRVRALLIAGSFAGLLAAVVLLWAWLGDGREALPPSLRWQQLTSFSDAAQIPAISPDGKTLVFLRGFGGDFGGSTLNGQIWSKALPEGDPVQLTRTPQRKQTIGFSLDSNRVLFTQIDTAFEWNTYEIPLLGAAEPKLFMANATGLSFASKDQVMYSAIKNGIHMVLGTSNLSRTDERDVYVPADLLQGMIHRSALSPDGKWVLGAEMDKSWWTQCRLIPFDGKSTGNAVGPMGSCTWAQWSPDGKWMYFTADGGTGYHIWRQRFPNGVPQQLTPSGASEEEGLSVMPDGKSLITASGTSLSEIWLHNEKTGDRQITLEGYALHPSPSPDGKKVYYLRKTGGSDITGELWGSDLKSGAAQCILPGLTITQFSISGDGKRALFATEQRQEHSGIWIGYLDGAQPPRQLTSHGEFRAFFGRPGEIIFQGGRSLDRVMRINEDGSDERTITDQSIMQLESVSPDGRWAIVGVSPPGNHGERNVMKLALSLDKGDSFIVCDTCPFGFGSSRKGMPLISWSRDGKWLYLKLRYFGYSVGKTAAIPIVPGVDPTVIKQLKDEAAVSRLPGVRMLAAEDVAALGSPDSYLFTKKAAKTNLFRIYMLP